MTRIRIDDLPVAENLTPEQEALIQGAGLKPFRPSLEGLEGREVPALLAPGIDLTDGTLTFQAGQTRSLNANYGANVWTNDANQVVAQRGTLTNPGATVLLDRSQVTNIVFQGGFGKDTFTNHTDIPSSTRNLNQAEGDTHTSRADSERPPSTTFTLTSNYTNGRLPDTAAVSEAMRNNQNIGGASQAPPLALQGAPEGTKSFASVTKHVTVPKSQIRSGTFIHEVLYNIPEKTNSLTGDRTGTTPPGGGRAALAHGTTVGKQYQGADPPDGQEHHYVTTVYALNTEKLNLPDNATPEQMEAAIQAASIGQTSIVGTFQADKHADWNSQTNDYNPSPPPAGATSTTS